jgi:hypothetical protein
MKKAMIAAVAAVVAGGAFAACSYEPAPAAKAAWAYTWKFTGKTTDAVALKDTVIPGGACGYEGSTIKGQIVRVPSSLKIQGYTAYCDAVCTDFEALAEEQEIFYQVKPNKLPLSGGVAIEVANVIGKKAKNYEIAGVATFDGAVDGVLGADTFEYELVFAGFGKYDKKNGRPSSASGNFAGTLSTTWYVSKTRCAEAMVWDCTTLTYLIESNPSVAFGKWNFKFNKSMAKKLQNDKAANVYQASYKKLPKWARYWLNNLAD